MLKYKIREFFFFLLDQMQLYICVVFKKIGGSNALRGHLGRREAIVHILREMLSCESFLDLL